MIIDGAILVMLLKFSYECEMIITIINTKIDFLVLGFRDTENIWTSLLHSFEAHFY